MVCNYPINSECGIVPEIRLSRSRKKCNFEGATFVSATAKSFRKEASSVQWTVWETHNSCKMSVTGFCSRATEDSTEELETSPLYRLHDVLGVCSL